MSTIQELFQQAQLAEAAYASFIDDAGYLITTDAQLKTALQNEGFSAAQAAAFVAQWRVIDQYDNSAWGGLIGTGFSATVFERLDANQQPTGQYSFAIRGTDFPVLADLGADLSLAAGGVAFDQTLDMVNYILRLQAGANGLTRQVELLTGATSPSLTDNFVSGVGSGITGAQLTIVGHSLGGYLGMAFQRIFGGTADMLSTFNAPGFIRSDYPVFDQLTSLLGLPASTMAAVQGTNLVVPGDSISSFGAAPGGRQIVFSETENSATPFAAHDKSALTDSLAVYNLLATIDTSLNTSTAGIATITNILKASSNIAANSLESAVNALGKLFNVSATTFTANEFDSTNGRDLLYKAVQDIAAAIPANGGLTLRDLTAFNATQIASVAENNIAYRYALNALNPFVVVGADYSAHNTTGALDIYDSATGNGVLSQAWLRDRAAMLGALIPRNVQDANMAPYPIDTLYSDADNGITVLPANSGHVLESMQKQIRFGSDANTIETINGGMLDDHLYGMGGDDILTGGKGNDYLEGGSGFDTYNYTTGDGSDTILDTDGQGKVMFNGQQLVGGKRAAPNKWKDAQGNIYRLTPTGSSQLMTIDSNSGDHIEIQNFKTGDLGINLNMNFDVPVVNQPGAVTIQGDRAPYQMPWDYWLWVNYSATWPYLFDANGNIVRTSTPQQFYPDKIFGTGADNNLYAGDGFNVIFATGGTNDIVTGGNDDLIFGGEGRDQIHAGGMVDTVNAGGGDDIVYGEAGQDVIDGGVGDDFLVGGTEGDAMNGGAGDDLLYGNAFVQWDQAAIDSGAGSGLQGDILTGGAGDDVVVGDTGDDALFGGTGADSLYGREGNDVLMGDSDFVFVAPPLSEFDAMIGAARWPMGPYLNYSSPFTTSPMNNIFYQKTDNGAGSANQYEFKLTSTNPEAARDNWIQQATSGGNDILNGGSGDDWLFGEFGQDILSGGADNDVLVGGTGDDTYVFNIGDGIDTVIDDIGETNTLRFGVGVDPANIILRLGSLMLDLGNGDAIHIMNFDPDNADTSSSINRFEFADGTVLTSAELLARGFDLDGSAAADALTGTNLSDRMNGLEGDDTLNSGAGNDTLSGGLGNDTLSGGAGNDRYVFNLGDGADTVVDASGLDTLIIGSDLTEANLEGFRIGNDMLVTIMGTNDSVTLTNWFTQAEGVQRIEFADGSFLDATGIEGLLNRPPVANTDTVLTNEYFAQTIITTGSLLANDTDPNTGDVITFTGFDATTANGNNVIQDASGNLVLDIGNRYQSLAAGQSIVDSFGYTISDRKGATDSGSVNVTINGANDAPVTTADDASAQMEDVSITATGNVLENDSDVDQGTLLNVANAGAYFGQFGTLTLNADGSYNYVLDNASLGVQSLAQDQVVTDTFAYAATDGITSTPSELTVSITGTNDVPVVKADSNAVQEDVTLSAIGNVLANDSDVDQGTIFSVANAGVFAGQFGTLTLNADGSYAYALDNTSLGVQSLAQGQVVTDTFAYAATDGITSTPSELTVSITGTNDAPVVAVALSDASTLEDQTFSFTVPADTFTDIDQGDVLTYNAALSDGSALPEWLTFDAITQTLSGIPSNWDVGLMAVSVTATDNHGASATSTFNLEVQNVNDAPIVVAHMADQRVDNGKRFSITIPANTFDDWDTVHGDSLTFSATLVDGEDLPEWLKFDAATGTFSGKAKGSDSYDILLTATDKAGASVTQAFTFTAGKEKSDKEHDDHHDTPVRDTTQDEIIVSSSVNDIIHTGNGADTLVFAQGSGHDTVYGGIGTDNTLVLDGIAANGIALSKQGKDLILETGGTDQITLRDWYDSTANNKSLLTLDIITQAVAEFDCRSGHESQRKSDKDEIETNIAQYDFSAVVAAYDQVWSADNTLQHWNAAQALATAQLEHDDDAALGSEAFKEMSINSLLALGQGNQNLNAVQLNQNRI